MTRQKRKLIVTLDNGEIRSGDYCGDDFWNFLFFGLKQKGVKDIEWEDIP